MYSVEVDHSNPLALAWCLNKLEDSIPDIYNWNISVNGGGIDYGIFLNIDIARKEILISNQPYGGRYDSLEDVLEELEEEDDDDE